MDILAKESMLKEEYPWMRGFDDAIFDSIFNGDGAVESRLDLHYCGEELASTVVPPFCEMSVEAAAYEFMDDDGLLTLGLDSLHRYMDGYDAASHMLALEDERGLIPQLPEGGGHRV